MLLQHERAHLAQVRLKCLILRTLIRELSLGLGPLVLDHLLALVLLRREQEADDHESERNHEQIQPVSDGHPTEACPSRPGYPTLRRGSAFRTSFLRPTGYP